MRDSLLMVCGVVSGATSADNSKEENYGEPRYTPGGTQVPMTTPPRDENGEVPKPPALIPVPPFPMEEYYEKVEASGHEGRTMQLGAKGWSPTVNQWTEWQLREAAKEIQRRAMQPDPPRPRTSVVNDNPSWGQVFYPGKVIDAAAVLGEVCHQDRACNGSSGELLDRDRAFRSSSGELPVRDRAFRGSSGELLEQDRAVEHGLHGADQRGDRALQGMRYHGGEQRQGLHQRRDLLPGGSGVMPGYFGNGMGSDQAGSGPKMELPALPASTTPMDLGDWLILVGPIMKELGHHATTWWKRTVEEAHRYYEVWRTASPFAGATSTRAGTGTLCQNGAKRCWIVAPCCP